jgi:hypothetical protein
MYFTFSGNVDLLKFYKAGVHSRPGLIASISFVTHVSNLFISRLSLPTATVNLTCTGDAELMSHAVKLCLCTGDA